MRGRVLPCDACQGFRSLTMAGLKIPVSQSSVGLRCLEEPYLLGDRRSVKQADEVLDHDNSVPLQAIGVSAGMRVDGEDEQRPMLH